jgi:hypothetical protein
VIGQEGSLWREGFHVQGIVQIIWLVAPRLGAIVSAAAQDLNRRRRHPPRCEAECPNNVAVPRGRRTDSMPGAYITINDFIVSPPG